MKKIKAFFFHSPIRYIVSLILVIIIALINLIVNGFDIYSVYIDGIFLGGAIVFFMGCLVLVAYYGAFDTFSYAFSTVGKKKYENLYDYVQQKKERQKDKKPPFVPYMVVGLLFVIVAAIMLSFR